MKHKSNRFEKYLEWCSSLPEPPKVITRRDGTEFVSGPYQTKEEASRALALLVMPPAGHA